MWLLILFFLGTLFLTRIILIMTGRLKGPIIHMFERYGDDEPFFYPWPEFFFWMGVWLSLMQFLVASFVGVTLPTLWIGLLLFGLAFTAYRMTNKAREWAFLRHLYPLWLQDLWGRTTRLERRRIAYMWMRISWKARLYYNSSDQAFLQWADMIIMATLF